MKKKVNRFLKIFSLFYLVIKYDKNAIIAAIKIIGIIYVHIDGWS